MSSTVFDGTFPKAPGERVSPADAGSMAKIATSNSQAAMTAFGDTAGYYRFVGIEFKITHLGTNYQIIDWSQEARALDEISTHLILDRTYIHGSPTGNHNQGVALNSAHSAIIDSYLYDFHANLGDGGYAIRGWNGPGPYKIENNMLAASGINVMWGGVDPRFSHRPADITVKRNYFFKNPAWDGVWPHKNHFESKDARRILIEGNVFENLPTSSAQFWSVVLKSANQNGGNNVAETRDVTVRLNSFRNVIGFLDIIGGQALSGGTFVDANHIEVVNNVVLGDLLSDNSGNGIMYRVVTNAPHDIHIAHNTGFNTLSPMLQLGFTNSPHIKNLVFIDNIGQKGATYGITIHSSSGGGVGTAALNAHADASWTVTNNIMIGTSSSNHPAGNFYPSNIAAVGFVDQPGENYRLAVGSPYKGLATDGTDPGADIDAIEAATAFAISGIPGEDKTPPVRSSGSPSGNLLAGTTQTTISLTTNEAATCKYGTTANTAYGSIANTFSTTGGTSHSQLITGLSDGNNYNYYVRCQDSSHKDNTNDYVKRFG